MAVNVILAQAKAVGNMLLVKAVKRGEQKRRQSQQGAGRRGWLAACGGDEAEDKSGRKETDLCGYRKNIAQCRRGSGAAQTGNRTGR